MGPKKQRDPADVSNPELDAYIDTLNPDPTDLIVTYKPECVQKIGNFASADSRYLFEYAGEGREHLNWEKVEHLSPKLYRMLREIQEQDAEDMRVHGRKFKHFIFSNIKSGTFGAKIVATALIDIFGMNLGYRAAKHQRLLKKDPNWGKIMLTDPDVLHATKGDNFYLLSSVGVFDQPLSTPMRKEILKRFNSRPDNVYGDLARIIIMDAGFKEGIDLFDIKYVHVFEPQTTLADQKQVIGRGTRTCGQKGLDFHPTKGWPLYVNIYDSVFDDGTEFKFRDAKTVHELYLKSMGIDLRMLNLAVDMERVYIMGAIDHDLNQNIHEFSTQGTHGGSPTFVGEEGALGGEGAPTFVGGAKASAVAAVSNACQQGVIQGLMLPYDYKEAQRIVNAEFKDLKWEKPEMKNLCGGASQSDGDSLGQSGGGFFDWLNPANWLSSSKEQQQPLQQPLPQQPVQQQPVVGGAPSVITYNSTQKFVSEFFKPSLNRKGMLLSHSVGTGKTCSAIAAATNSFETEGYTILWVTRTTLKNDIWKNMFDQICSATIGDAFNKGLVSAAELEDPKRRMKLLSKAWAIRPMSYKQFSNLVSGKNALYKALVKRNGAADPLKKTLLIIDEAHKLYGESDLSAIERPDTTVLYESLMRSYEISGKDSVRLLLMTATPITTSPMELVQLINLCRERDAKIEDNFNLFAETYLDETGMFTKAGERRFLNEIAGHISHLNREKDARMFSQPVVSFVRVPLLSEPYYNQFDPQLVRGMAQARMQAIKKRIDNNAENIMAYKLAKTEENQIKGVCDEYEEPREQKACKKVMRKTLRNIKSHIRDTKRILRDENKEVRDEYKNINQSIKARVSQAREILDERRAFYGHRGSDSSNSSSSSSSSSNKSSLSEEEHKKSSSSSSSSKAGGGWETDDEEEEKKARELEPFNPTDKKPIPGLDDDYQKYRQSVFYNIKQKCRVQPKRATFNNYPKVQHHLTLVKGFETQIQNNRNALRQERKNAATRLKTMKQNSLKKGLTSIERATMQRAWKEDTKQTRRYFKERAQQVAYENRSIMEDVKLHKNQAKEYKKTLEKAYKKTKRLKTRLEKKRRRESLKLGKTMEELKADAIELTDEFKAKQRELREFIDTNREAMMDEINTEVGDIKHVAEETLKMKQALAMHKEAKQAEKAKRDAEKEEERERKAEEKARKEAEREKEREQKAEEKARKEEEKARKEVEKKQKQEERARKEAAKKK